VDLLSLRQPLDPKQSIQKSYITFERKKLLLIFKKENQSRVTYF